MPVYDSCEPQIVRALEKAGWTVTPGPHLIYVPGRRNPLMADIHAQRGDNHMIIAEVKCFTDKQLDELYTSIGQYLVYRSMLKRERSTTPLYLAIPQDVYETLFMSLAMDVVRETGIKLLVVNIEQRGNSSMDRIIDVEQEQLVLAQVVRREVALYEGTSDISKLHAILDDEHQKYTVLVVENDRSLEVPVWVFIMARVEGDFVIIEEDTSMNKHLYEALMKNGGIPREKIILAYKGETLPEKS